MAVNFQQVTDAKAAEALAEGRKHLHFIIRLYKIKVEEGRHCLHEHPQGATSSQDPQVIAPLRHSRVKFTVGRPCQYGLQTPTKNCQFAPAKKATMFAPTPPRMLSRLSRKCDGSHTHQHLIAGRAAAAAFFYPEALVQNILRGIRDTRDAEVREAEGHEGALLVQNVHRAGTLHDIPAELDARLQDVDLKHNVENAKLRFRFRDGSSQLLNLPWKETYRIEYTSDPLPYNRIRDAMVDEMSVLCDEVLEGVTMEHVREDPDRVNTGGRWINCNKQDTAQPKCRGRYVGQEVAAGGGADPAVYAATPPHGGKTHSR